MTSTTSTSPYRAACEQDQNVCPECSTEPDSRCKEGLCSAVSVCVGGAMQENTVAQAAIRNGLYKDKEAMWENMSHRLMWGMQDTERHKLR